MGLLVKNLEKSFKTGFLGKKKKILKNLSFEVADQKTTGFIGVNGAGKTTSLKCILGFIRPDQGEISFFGEKQLTKEVKSKIGYLPERPYFYEFLTAKEFLKFHWDLTGGGLGFDEASENVLRQVNLLNVHDKFLRSFSKGMLQRIGFAQALIRNPKILILDEPMSGLDPDGRMLIKDIIHSQRQKGTTIFFSSHLLNDMDELCDELVIIDSGELLFNGSKSKFDEGQGVEHAFKRLRQQMDAQRSTL